MTLFFPDVSEYNYVSLAGAELVCARATIGNVTDIRFSDYASQAVQYGIPFTAYHFLNSAQLGVSIAEQADHAYSVIGSATPTMVDVEPNLGHCATLSEAINWVTRFRRNGGMCHLGYVPPWALNQIGTDLTPLSEMGVYLVSSNYTTYSDNGPGWQSYGGVTPVQWQYTDSGSFTVNGPRGDMNAFKGTLTEYWSLVTGGTMAGILLDLDNITFVTDKGETKTLRNFLADVYSADWNGLGPAVYQLTQLIKSLPTNGMTDADRQLLTTVADKLTQLNAKIN